MARDDEAFLLRAPSRNELDTAVAMLRQELGTAVRIHIDPYRFYRSVLNSRTRNPVRLARRVVGYDSPVIHWDKESAPRFLLTTR